MVPLQFLGNWLGVSAKFYHELLGEPAGKSFQELVRLCLLVSLCTLFSIYARGVNVQDPSIGTADRQRACILHFSYAPMPAIQFNVCLFVHLFVHFGQTGFELILV